jgi:oxalate decarboxylase/phosphoglucose isomerase-like protein (cupin superfamily)
MVFLVLYGCYGYAVVERRQRRQRRHVDYVENVGNIGRKQTRNYHIQSEDM